MDSTLKLTTEWDRPRNSTRILGRWMWRWPNTGPTIKHTWPGPTRSCKRPRSTQGQHV